MSATKIFVFGETPFQIPKHSFAIGESDSGYTLYSSVDCKDADDVDATFAPYPKPTAYSANANEQIDILNVPSGRWWKLKGNNGKVCVRF